jgi:hypothetical protein
MKMEGVLSHKGFYYQITKYFTQIGHHQMILEAYRNGDGTHIMLV